MELRSPHAAIVTGGASGLGEASARMLAAEGVKVAVFDMNISAIGIGIIGIQLPLVIAPAVIIGAIPRFHAPVFNVRWTINIELIRPNERVRFFNRGRGINNRRGAIALTAACCNQSKCQDRE